MPLDVHPDIAFPLLPLGARNKPCIAGININDILRQQGLHLPVASGYQFLIVKVEAMALPHDGQVLLVPSRLKRQHDLLLALPAPAVGQLRQTLRIPPSLEYRLYDSPPRLPEHVAEDVVELQAHLPHRLLQMERLAAA